MTKRAGKKKRRAHVTVVPVETTAENGPVSSGPTEAGHDAPVVPQSGSQPAALPHPDEPMLSVFWPELDPARHAAADAKDVRDGVPAIKRANNQADREDTYKRLWEWRAEIQAVKQHYNVPQGLRDRMVFEAAKTMTNPSVPTRERLAALALLKAMDAANRTPGNLPPQIQVNNTTNIGVATTAPAAADGPKLSPQAIVAAMLERADVLDAIDVYEFKDSNEDYAS